ncbi:hypothetical protein SUGI_0623960 [Cryptomeria japonica]|uniref:probable serine/threonine-protein kinase At1g54610 n=1 Tax=Cryptomeria japonica TaxID=3369 RepID=UPI002414AEE2|nr:probable serine/threonine-protein kinase At1g54610 [Cryptomeria japonica]GLJ31139.1 hypothetical protein SUGI_0623960 [Cryptomeria japonica]
MGSVCGKPRGRSESPAEKRGLSSITSHSPAARRLVVPAGRDEVIERDGSGQERDHRAKHKGKVGNGAAPVSLLADDGEKQRHQQQHQQQQQQQQQQHRHPHHQRPPVDIISNTNSNLRLGNPPRHTEGEQVAAGWPAWLTAVAGEAIKGWIPRRADSFEKLDKIGQGTYSNVYKARDLDTGKIVALKKVRFDNLEPESVRFMAREIQVLRRLDHPNVVKLEGLVTSRMSCSLYLVFEYMEHDLAGLAACPGIKFTEPQVKCYMQQLLRGLDHCHGRGVLHRDIKGSNLLIDNGGVLKIADFGLATFFHPDQRQPLTSRVVTLWYRPPELLLGATEYGVAVDLWSTGCILAELLAGKPIMPGRTEVEQLHKIFKLCGSPSEDYWRKSKLPHATIFKPQQPYKRCVAENFKDFPASALALMDVLLAIEPADRGTAAAALKSDFFCTKPLACDPSSLPKYPPSKEFDAKIRDEEARRQRAAGGRGRGSDATRRLPRESRAVPAPDANAELATSIQKRRMTTQASSKSKSEKFNSHQEYDAVGFPIDPPRPVQVFTEAGGTSRGYFQQAGPSHSGPLSNTYSRTSTWGKKLKEDDIRMAPNRSSSRSKQSALPEFKKQGAYGPETGADLSNFSSLVAARSNAGIDPHRERSSMPQHNYIDAIDGIYNNGKHEYLEVPEHSIKQDWTQVQQQESFKGLDNYQLQELPATHFRREERVASKEPTMGYGGPGERIHYSGPLLPPSGNVDELLKEHERHIQQAVRRARQDKVKSQRNNSSHLDRKAFEQVSFVSLANGNAGSVDHESELLMPAGSSRLKVSKTRGIEEIVELKELEREPLSSVVENSEREQDL